MSGCLLALDAGGTGSRAGLYKAGRLVAEAAGPPANAATQGVAIAAARLARLCRDLLAQRPGPVETIAAAVAGAATEPVREALATALAQAVDSRRVVVSDDILTVLFASGPHGGRGHVVVVAGTGSGVAGRMADGSVFRMGGRGHVMGDDGSAYDLARRALRCVAHAEDGAGPPTALGKALCHAAHLATFTELGPWSASAGKEAVAALAPAVTAAASKGGEVAVACVRSAADALAAVAGQACGRLGDGGCTAYLAGGLFEKSRLYRDVFTAALAERAPRVRAEPAPRTGHGAAAMLRQDGLPADRVTVLGPDEATATALPETEQSGRADHPLDALTANGIVERMVNADASVQPAVASAAPDIARAVAAAAEAIRTGGRVIYVGAGTSGRLGALDASECPPTFGVPADRVVGVIAGGEKALRHSVEGAEDDREQAASDLAGLERPPGEGDLVVGIAASGRTPYVDAALRSARERGALTALVCCTAAPVIEAGITICLPTGPEVLPGSTRLRAGTATKMALNIISTGAMALAGCVYEGHMVGVQPVNGKLRLRAARMIVGLAGLDPAEAQGLLAASGNSVRTALVMARRGVSRDEAEALLREKGGLLRDVLDPPR